MTLMQQILPQFLLGFFEFLAIPLIDNHICFLSVWSIIHLGMGALILYLVRKEKYALLVVFELLVLFEFFEFSVSYLVPIILKETILDTVWDLIVGFMGAFMVWIFLKVKTRKIYLRNNH